MSLIGIRCTFASLLCMSTFPKRTCNDARNMYNELLTIFFSRIQSGYLLRLEHICKCYAHNGQLLARAREISGYLRSYI